MKCVANLMLVLALCTCAADGLASENNTVPPRAEEKMRPTAPVQVGGLLGERLDLWRQHRLWRVGRDPMDRTGRCTFAAPPPAFGASPGQGPSLPDQRRSRDHSRSLLLGRNLWRRRENDVPNSSPRLNVAVPP